MKKTHDLDRRLLKGSAVVLLVSSLTSPLGYLIRSYYSHNLPIESFGLFFAVLTFFNMISTYSDFGFGATITYFLPKYLKANDYSSALKVFRYGQFTQIGSAILISFLILPFSKILADDYFKVPGSENLIYISCLYLISMSFLNSLIHVFIGLQKEILYSSINLIRLLLTLSFSLLFSFFDAPNILYYAWAWTIGYFLTAVIFSFILSRNHSDVLGQKLNWDKDLFKTMSAYAFPTLATTSLTLFISYSDTFFLTLMRDVREVGIYNVILPLASIPIMFLLPLQNFLFPLISHLTEGEKDKVHYLVDKTLQIAPLIGIYFGLFIILFPSIIIKLIFGSQWLGLVEIPLVILSAGYIATGIYTTLGIFVAGLGEVKKRVKITSIIAAANIILSILLVPLLGVTGVVIANTTVALISVFLFGRVINSIIHFSYPIIYYLKIFAFSAGLFLIVRYFKFEPTNWINFFATGIAYTIIFLAFTYYLKVFDKSVIKLIRKG